MSAEFRRYMTADGESIGVRPGYHVWVNEGNSADSRDFSGIIVSLDNDGFTIRVASTRRGTDPAPGSLVTVRPADLADVAVDAP